MAESKQSGGVQRIRISSTDGSWVTNLNVISCSVSCRARMIKHPVESGQEIFDNKIIDPRAITIRAIVDASDTSTKAVLRRMYRERRFKFCTVQTREATYKNFSCDECSHEEDTEKLDKLQYTIRFLEIIQSRSREQALDPDDTNVVDHGTVGA